jgi:hypothetical protein
MWQGGGGGELLLPDLIEQQYGAVQNIFLAPGLIMIPYEPEDLGMWNFVWS